MDDKLKAIREKQKAARRKATEVQQAIAAKASPPITGSEFMARMDDVSQANVGQMSGVVSLQPWVGMCAVPLNLIPYRGCSNNCAYCLVNQMARGNIARKSGVDRKFYASVGDLAGLEAMLQVGRGQRRLEDLPQSQQLYGWFFQKKTPARLSALTDPFMKLEATRHKSYEILQLCKAYGYPVIVNTKGGDLFDDALDFIISLPQKIVQISLISVDDDVAREYEPNAPPISQRIAAIQRLKDAEVYVSVRMAPLIPDPRIVSEEHLSWYARVLAQVGVNFVEIKPLRAHRGVQTETENPVYKGILKGLDTELFFGNQYSIPLAQLKEIGLRIRGCFAEQGVRYSSGHYLGRFSPFGDDTFSACHCADLDQVGWDYHKATFSYLGLEAKRLWEKHRCPVLIQRGDLDRYGYPPDEYIFPARSKVEQLPYGALLDLWWIGVGEWLWTQPYFWQMGYESIDPGLDYDALYGLVTYFYDPHAPLCRDTEILEQHRLSYAERSCVLLSGEKVPFPEDQPNHPFWASRRTAFYQSQEDIPCPKERR